MVPVLARVEEGRTGDVEGEENVTKVRGVLLNGGRRIVKMREIHVGIGSAV